MPHSYRTIINFIISYENMSSLKHLIIAFICKPNPKKKRKIDCVYYLIALHIKVCT